MQKRKRTRKIENNSKTGKRRKRYLGFDENVFVVFVSKINENCFSKKMGKRENVFAVFVLNIENSPYFLRKPGKRKPENVFSVFAIQDKNIKDFQGGPQP